MPKTKKHLSAVILLPLPIEIGNLGKSQMPFSISLDKPWLLTIAGLLLGIYKIHNFNKNKK